MPTPTGLPKPGEKWKRTCRLPRQGTWYTTVIEFMVLERGRGDYWPLRVEIISYRTNDPIDRQMRLREKRQLWVDAAYYFSQGQLEFIA